MTQTLDVKVNEAWNHALKSWSAPSSVPYVIAPSNLQEVRELGEIGSALEGDHGNYLRGAGAEVIQGTTTDVFKRVIGKADEVYTK